MATRLILITIVQFGLINAFAPFEIRFNTKTFATQTTTCNLVASPAIREKTKESSSPLAPLTVWGNKISNIVDLQQNYLEQPKQEFGVTISAKDLGLGSVEEEVSYLKEHSTELTERLQQTAAIIFRDFNLMKTQDGFVEFYSILGMKTCLDPLHSVSARPTVDGTKNSPVYEAVNKESRKNFFIGMHNEFVGTRAPRAAAFVCFKAAEKGGEFIIADGRSLFRDLDPKILEKLYNRSIRYSVMELPFFSWIDGLPEFMQDSVSGIVKSVVSAAINAKVDFDVELLWGEGGYDQVKMLQARAPKQPPIVIHPTTGDPTWFCNVHSHSSVLRKNRESLYGAERFEDGASQINKSDMFYGDDGALSPDELQHLDDITQQNMVYVKMNEGDAVLLDNYKCMHGRNVFDGTRKHGVAWFEGWES